jgi:hypothetical protein
MLPRLGWLLLLVTAKSGAGSNNQLTAVWSVWSNCDCSGLANKEQTAAVCAPLTIAPTSVQLDCAVDGMSVTVRTFASGGACSGEVTTNTTYPVGRCLPDTPASGTVMSKFKCVKEHTPRAQSIVGKQYGDTTCGADAKPVIAETNYVSGCFASCSPPTPSRPMPNLWQVADASGLAGSYCNGTTAGTCDRVCAPDGKVNIGDCQVLGKSTSVKYSWWAGL